MGFYAGHAFGVWYIDDVSLTPEIANGIVHFDDPDSDSHDVTESLSTIFDTVDDNGNIISSSTDGGNIGHFTINSVNDDTGNIDWHYTIDQTHVAGITFQPYELKKIRDGNMLTIENDLGDNATVKLEVQIGTRGADVFEFDYSVNIETITNFSNEGVFKKDRIDLTDFSSIQTFACLVADHIQSTNNGQDTTITLDSTHTLQLTRVRAATLQALDFILAA